MIRNYLLVALRQLWKSKFYSLINIAGLVAGVCGFLLIMLYVAHDLRFDQYHAKKDRLYRLTIGHIERGAPHSAVTGGVMPHVLQQNYPGIEKVARFRKLPSLVRHDEKALFEERFFFTDSTAFDMFTFPFVEGDPARALTEPYTVVLTEDAAMRFFGRAQGVTGELLQVDESMTFKVTGVLENIPDFSHFKFDFLASASTLPMHPQVQSYQLTGWYAHYFYNYILLEEKADPASVAKSIVTAHKQHSDPEDYKLYGRDMGLYLQPLTEIHLNPLYGEIDPQGDKTILLVLAGVAVLILLLACINFANISTVLSMTRRKEVGLRKTLGARRAQVVLQFMGESLLVCCVTFALALVFVELLMPWFNVMTGKQIAWTYLVDGRTLFTLAGAVGATAVLGGFYPSYIAGRFSPAGILRGNAGATRSFGFRKAVIIFQFTISMVLISGALIISSQVKHMLSKDLGLTTRNVLAILTHGDPQVHQKLPVLFDRLAQLPSVGNSTECELIPGETVFGIIARIEGQDNINYSTIAIGYDYLDVFGIQLIAGRDFSRAQPMDTVLDRVIVNESLVRMLGWTPEQAIGKAYDRGGDGEHPGEIIGVVRDFNFTSVKREVGPVVFMYARHFFNKAAVRLEPGTPLPAAVAEVRKVWESVYPGRPFDFRFADESVEQQYRAEQKFGNLFAWFSALAIFIGVLGLFGMVSLDLNLRTREVGIRKVLGATLSHLIGVLSRDFMKLVLAAFAISVPLAWWLCHLWLSNFAYKIDRVAPLIAIPALGVVALASAVVVVQTLKSALANPVEALKSE